MDRFLCRCGFYSISSIIGPDGGGGGGGGAAESVIEGCDDGGCIMGGNMPGGNMLGGMPTFYQIKKRFIE
jgi:hypothetical protein